MTYYHDVVRQRISNNTKNVNNSSNKSSHNLNHAIGNIVLWAMAHNDTNTNNLTK